MIVVDETTHDNKRRSQRLTKMQIETKYEHVVMDEDGVVQIAATTMKVIELVLDHLAYGWSPEELKFQHPQLTEGQIYSDFPAEDISSTNLSIRPYCQLQRALYKNWRRSKRLSSGE